MENGKNGSSNDEVAVGFHDEHVVVVMWSYGVFTVAICCCHLL